MDCVNKQRNQRRDYPQPNFVVQYFDFKAISSRIREQLMFDSHGYYYRHSIQNHMSLQQKNGSRWKLDGDGIQSLLFPFTSHYQVHGLSGGLEWIVSQSRMTLISRDITVLHGFRISSSHSQARFELVNNVPYIIDLATRSGTRVNADKITCCPLKPGDNIIAAETVFVFRCTCPFLMFMRPSYFFSDKRQSIFSNSRG